ncbi:MAG: arylamine N-acetyltransferase [Pseudomonadota bacterium]
MTRFLDTWLNRVGLRERPAPTVDSLGLILRHQLRTIPFENLTVLGGQVPDLDDAALERKLIADRRGGYCFELNGLLDRALRDLGYSVTPLMARVMWNKDAPPGPRSHLLLRVEVEGAGWLMDAGFGGPTPGVPIPCQPGVHGDPRFALKEEPGLGTVLSRKLASGEFAALYAFTAERVGPADIAGANWLMATWPPSPFRSRLVAAMGDDQLRHIVEGRSYRAASAEGEAHEENLDTPEALFACLARVFGLSLTAAERAGATRLCFPGEQDTTAEAIQSG